MRFSSLILEIPLWKRRGRRTREDEAVYKIALRIQSQEGLRRPITEAPGMDGMCSEFARIKFLSFILVSAQIHLIIN